MLTQTKGFKAQITKQFIGIMVVIIIFCSVVKRWTEGARGCRGHTCGQQRYRNSEPKRNNEDFGRFCIKGTGAKNFFRCSSPSP